MVAENEMMEKVGLDKEMTFARLLRFLGQPVMFLIVHGNFELDLSLLYHLIHHMSTARMARLFAILEKVTRRVILLRRAAEAMRSLAARQIAHLRLFRHFQMGWTLDCGHTRLALWARAALLE